MTKKASKGTLFVISGPSGVGKGTLRKELFRRLGRLSYSVSCTTRAPRTGEKDGVDYFFLDRETFDELLSRGAFLEWAEVHGNLYGTLEETVKNSLAEGKDVILEIDVQGAIQVKEHMPEAVLIFIAPPGENELVRRLNQRGTEREQELKRRLENARKELNAASDYDHIIINDDIDRASSELEDIVKSYRNKKNDIPFPRGDWQVQQNKDRSVPTNKFLEAQIVAKRAKQLSERKGQNFLEEGKTNPIEQAMRELAEGKLRFILPSQKAAEGPLEGAEDGENGLEKA